MAEKLTWWVSGPRWERDPGSFQLADIFRIDIFGIGVDCWTSQRRCRRFCNWTGDFEFSAGITRQVCNLFPNLWNTPLLGLKIVEGEKKLTKLGKKAAKHTYFKLGQKWSKFYVFYYPDSHHSQGGMKFATQMSPLLNW